jgi:DNA polymerase alpha subunit A
MTKLQVIPLTKQLTTIAGNTWIRSLQSARAERNEMLLMHEFWRQNYILPDSNKQMKAKFEDGNDDEEDGPTKKKYAGGMVLEPKPDIYTDFVLLLDFNSLYPSIIREYNICFTTIQRKKISLEEFTKEVRVEKKPKQKKGEAN